MSIEDIVTKCKIIKGSLMGNRQDLREALQFAADGKVRPNCYPEKLENVNEAFERILKGEINGRVVMQISKSD